MTTTKALRIFTRTLNSLLPEERDVEIVDESSEEFIIMVQGAGMLSVDKYLAEDDIEEMARSCAEYILSQK